jgi:TIR domain-containing protein/3-keto-disaccharide hydrolase
MTKVFMSYRRGDSASITGRVYDRLVARFGAQNIFKDVDNIPPGANFGVYIRDSLRQCAVGLVIIGPHWLDEETEDGARRLDDPQDWVRTEIETAFSLGLTVIPVLVEGARVPRAAALPEALRELAQINSLQVRNDPDFTHDIARLISALERPLAVAPANATPAAQAAPPPAQALPPVNTPLQRTQTPPPLQPAGSARMPIRQQPVVPYLRQGTATHAPRPSNLPRRVNPLAVVGATLAIVVVVASFAVLFSVGPGRLLFANSEPTQTAGSASVTATATATATVSTSLTPFVGSPTYQDSLSDNSVGNWLIYSDQYHTCGFRGGQYHATVAPVYGIECVNSKFSWKDFALEVKMTILADGQTAGGISFRHVSPDRLDSRGYELIIYQSGRMVLAECPGASNCGVGTGDKKAATFNVGLGKTNTIRILAKGPQISIYSNGQLVISAADSNYASGYISLNASYADFSGDVAYSDLKIWQA